MVSSLLQVVCLIESNTWEYKSILTDLRASCSVNNPITGLIACVIYISSIGYLIKAETAVVGNQLVDQSNMFLLLWNKLWEVQRMLIYHI